MAGYAGKTVLVLVLAGITALAALLLLDRMMPLPSITPDAACVVTARDRTPLRAFAAQNGIWRYPVNTSEVSELYLQALITYEDRWFYTHPGVNPVSLARAWYQNLKAGRTVSGGSTLTMQAARLIDPCPRTIGGKIWQIFRALQLEWHYSKDQILSFYLNHAPFGSNIEGVQAAAFTWLGKSSAEVSHAEAALLAVLPQAPSRFRPDRHPKRAKAARDKVLDRLLAFGVWPEDTVREAKMEPVVSFRAGTPVIAPLLARLLHSENPGKELISTCIDYDLQLHCRDIVAGYTQNLPKEQSAAVLAVNHKTLEVPVYIGSADFFDDRRYGHVDMIRAARSPGSTLKPFVYGLAMDRGLIHSHSLLSDTPRYKKDYDPGNFSSGFTGPVSAAAALQMSLNVPAVQVLEAYGPRPFFDRLRHGMARLELNGQPNLSIILGGMGTDLESLVTLYTALARQGLSAKPRFTPGEMIQERYVMSPGAAWIIHEILTRPLPGYEGISRLSTRVPVAWKTGTSYGFRDAWAIGIMGDYVAGIWVGRPDGSPSPGQYGTITAIPLLQRILAALPRSGSTRPPPPDSVTREAICWPLGYEESRFPGSCLVRHDAWILDRQVPVTMTGGLSGDTSLFKTIWVDEAGRRATPVCGGIKRQKIALFPAALDPWLPPQWRRSGLIPKASEKCPNLAPVAGHELSITGISDGSVLTRPPGPAGPLKIPLAATGGEGKRHWFLNRVPIAGLAHGQSGTFAVQNPGRYQLAVLDASGSTDCIYFDIID